MGKKQHQKDKMYLTTTEWSTLYGGKKTDTPGRSEKAVNFLDQFSLLGEFDVSVRLDAVTRIVQLVAAPHLAEPDAGALKKDTGSKLLVEDRRGYALKRLIRGLASSNKCARIGFSDALTELLRRVDYTPAEFMELMEEWLPLQTKENKAQMFIGRLLAWGALIRARRATPLLAECIKELLGMDGKDFLESVVCHLLAELVVSVNGKSFELTAWPLVRQYLTDKTKDPTPIAVFLTILVRRHYPALLEQVVNLKQKLLSEDAMCSVLQKSTSQLPRIHPLVPMILEEARKGEDWDAFWTNVVEKLATVPTPEKHFLLLHILKTVFVQFDSLDFLMKEIHVDQLIYPLVHTGSPLYAQARSLVATLEGLADTKAKQILRFILSHPNGYRFDHMTKSALVSKILQKASPDLVQWYSNKLQKRLEAIQGLCTGESQLPESHVRFDAIIMEQLANLTHMANMFNQTEFKRKVCEYVAKMYFSGDVRLSKKPNVQALLKALAPSGKSPSLVQSADNISAVLHIYLTMENRHPSFRHEKKLRAACKLLSKLNKCDKDADTCLGLRVLVGYLALCYALGVQQDVTVVDDVMSSAKAFLIGRQEGDEVEWIDLVMEALVSALSVENAHFRAMVLSALGLLYKHITTDSLNVLLAVFRDDEQPEDLTQLEEFDSSEDDEEKGGSAEGSDDDSDEDDDDDEVAKDASRSRNGVEQQSDSHSGGADFDYTGFRTKLSQVLGVDGSDDDDEDVPATDEDMMKLDSVISEVFGDRFKSMSSESNKERRRKELRALHFEMKCLHILDSYVKSIDVSLAHIFVICKTLLEFAASQRARWAHRPIIGHIAETLRDVSSMKVASIRVGEITLDEMKEFGMLVAKLMQSVDEPELRVALNSLLPFVVKCVKASGVDDEEWYLGLYRDLLSNYLEQTTTRLSPSVFVRFVEVFSEHSLCMVDILEATLVDYFVKKREKRVQVLGLLVAALKLCNPARIEKKRLKKSMKKLASAVSHLLERTKELAFTINLYVEFLDLMRLISRKCQEAELEDYMASCKPLLMPVFKELSTKNMPSKIKRRLTGVRRQFFPGEQLHLDAKQAKKNQRTDEDDKEKGSSHSKKRKIGKDFSNGHKSTDGENAVSEDDNEPVEEANSEEEEDAEVEEMEE